MKHRQFSQDTKRQESTPALFYKELKISSNPLDDAEFFRYKNFGRF